VDGHGQHLPVVEPFERFEGGRRALASGADA
jgi:hypothetical protein